jgi:hypothetical protein
VQAFARVFFQMHAGDADLLAPAAHLDFNGTVLSQGFVVL